MWEVVDEICRVDGELEGADRSLEVRGRGRNREGGREGRVFVVEDCKREEGSARGVLWVAVALMTHGAASQSLPGTYLYHSSPAGTARNGLERCCHVIDSTQYGKYRSTYSSVHYTTVPYLHRTLLYDFTSPSDVEATGSCFFLAISFRYSTQNWHRLYHSS